jgi:G:T-mismatch repair DNA endonuclease (very short patch repair protein)
VLEYKDKDWLYKKYVREGLSLHDIAKLFEVDAQTIRYWMKKFNIPTRRKEDAVTKHFADRKKIYTNTCKHCSKQFEVADLSKTREGTKAFIGFCSDECRKTHRKEERDVYSRICPCCNRLFNCEIKSMTDPNSSKFKKYCSMKCVLVSTKKSNTWIEVEIREFLKSQEIDFIEQHRVGRYTIDFYIPESSIAVEANGDFWHANPSIYSGPLYRIQEDAIIKDKRKIEKLNAKGIKVLVVWENDLKTIKDETLRAVLSQIKSA